MFRVSIVAVVLCQWVRAADASTPSELRGANANDLSGPPSLVEVGRAIPSVGVLQKEQVLTEDTKLAPAGDAGGGDGSAGIRTGDPKGESATTSSSLPGSPAKTDKARLIFSGVAGCGLIALGMNLALRTMPRLRATMVAISLGAFYVLISSIMIESNKWLMQPGHFPYPFTLTMNHMLMSFVLANVARVVSPSMFPAFQNLVITPRFCTKFLCIGVPFAASLVCGNWAYKYLSVSFLQIMKQSNIVTIFAFSVIAGMEQIRRCNVTLLAIILIGAMMGVEGELHFVLAGFMLQVISSLCEATKVLVQSIMMSGQAKLDPLTMVLFMAPACFLSNLVPQAAIEGPARGEIVQLFLQNWPVIAGNACLAFVLNCTVAQCIKQLSAVGYLLCGIVKDTCIIVTSTWFMGESLTVMQKTGFSLALGGVASYSMYKQNAACFEDDSLFTGFSRVAKKLTARGPTESATVGIGLGTATAGFGNAPKSDTHMK